MNKYTCIIVDDETLAQELIETHLAKFPNVEILAKCHTTMEALSVLNDRQVDMMFLDIEMPDLTGIELLKALDKQPYTVFTTAYSEYAIESYELNVVDYLLKPVRFERFFKAMTKILNLLKEQDVKIAESEKTTSADYIFVKSDYKAVKIRFSEILYVESMQKYVKFYLKDKMVMSLMSISSLEEILPQTRFFRCQKSFIVNLDFIESIEGNQIVLATEMKIPVSKNLKQRLIELVDKNGLI